MLPCSSHRLRRLRHCASRLGRLRACSRTRRCGASAPRRGRYRYVFLLQAHRAPSRPWPLTRPALLLVRSAHYLHEGLRSSQTSLLHLQCPSTRRRCPSLFSSGLRSVEWLLLCLLLTAVSPALGLSTQVASCKAGSQPSPGIAQSLPRLSPPHLHHDSPGKYRTSAIRAASSPSQCLVCGSCSSVQRFASAFLQTPPHDRRPWRAATLPLAGCGWT